MQKGPDDPLAVGDAGSFEQLAIRPNPEGHVIVTVPDVESLIEALAQERGRPLSEQELREVRASATSLVMSKSDASKLNALRAERSTQ